MNWLLANKEWLFSGLLVAVPIALIGWLFARRRAHASQVQRSGNSSINLQAGGNINMGGGTTDERSNTKGR
jgi:hypothetical protein